MQHMNKSIFKVIAVALATAAFAFANLGGPVIGPGGPFNPGGRGGLPPVTNTLPAVQVVATDPTALEGTSTGAFTLVRTGPYTNDLSVTLKIDGTATNGVNYTEITNVVTIPAGQRAVDIVIQPLAASPSGNDQTVVLSIQKSDGYVAQGGSAKVTIVQNSLHGLPPTVAISSPTNGAVITGTTVDLEAHDPNAQIDRVAFYHGDTLIGVVNKSPFNFVWSNAPAGAYTLRAWAEGAGQWSVSDPVNITVSNTLPTITITSPTNGWVELGPATVTITADVSDPESLVTKVNFLANDHLLGSVSSAPYTLVVTNLGVGNYDLVASAVTGVGHVDSAKVSISLTNDTPVVTLTSPATNITVPVGTPIALAATATDGASPIAFVSFLADGFPIGRVSNAPYALNWTNAFPGHYSIRAKAVSVAGVSAYSSAVTVDVKNQPPTVAITAPVDGASVKVGATVEIDATATDPDDGVREVDFFVDGRLAGKATTAPYSTTITAKHAGNHQITAIAIDHYGATGKAKTVTLTVTP
jgi:Bacterial Ig domain